MGNNDKRRAKEQVRIQNQNHWYLTPELMAWVYLYDVGIMILFYTPSRLNLLVTESKCCKSHQMKQLATDLGITVHTAKELGGYLNSEKLDIQARKLICSTNAIKLFLKLVDKGLRQIERGTIYFTCVKPLGLFVFIFLFFFNKHFLLSMTTFEGLNISLLEIFYLYNKKNIKTMTTNLTFPILLQKMPELEENILLEMEQVQPYIYIYIYLNCNSQTF